MTQVIQEKHRYPQDSEALFKIYVTEDWIPQRYEGIGARNVQVLKCEQNGDTYTVNTKREVKADVPKALAKFAKEWNSVEQRETWTVKGDGIYDCEFSVRISGLPVEMQGHMVVQPDGDGSLNDIELKVVCAIPIVGKKAEEFVAGDSQKSMDGEHEWIKAFLAQ
ncbi:conserved hypothetical protein [gamma proteobacterium HTCC5015]|nr:conserved hypothetical protein [gamma proteobacterium HTCC5015]